jgi:hypothetical protein
VAPEGAFFSTIAGRLLEAMRAETALLSPARRPRRERTAPDLENALGWQIGRAHV